MKLTRSLNGHNPLQSPACLPCWTWASLDLVVRSLLLDDVSTSYLRAEPPSTLPPDRLLAFAIMSPGLSWQKLAAIESRCSGKRVDLIGASSKGGISAILWHLIKLG